MSRITRDAFSGSASGRCAEPGLRTFVKAVAPSCFNFAPIRRICATSRNGRSTALSFFEGVNNALKLLGDQYLARLYRLVAQRFHLVEWDGSILRKLETLEGIYQKISDQVVRNSMEC